MLAIHGIWAHGVLSLWAEDSDGRASPPPGHDRLADMARAHPFAARCGLLADVVADFGESAGDVVRKAADDEVSLWLPTTASGPIASPDLATTPTEVDAEYTLLAPDAVRPGSAGLSARQGRVRLAPWRVPALSFDPAAALVLLGALSRPETLPERGIAAGSVQFLAALAALAADLTT